jgi:MarR family transcriptional regulator, organic hydroperoxide resistance regulator
VVAVLRDAEGPLTVREIGERLVCEGGSPSRLVASVVEAGLLVRAGRPGDRRAVEHTLTAAGRSAARRVSDAERRLYDELGAALGDRDVQAVVRGLRRLVDGRPAGAAIERRRAASAT